MSWLFSRAPTTGTLVVPNVVHSRTTFLPGRFRTNLSQAPVKARMAINMLTLDPATPHTETGMKGLARARLELIVFLARSRFKDKHLLAILAGLPLVVAVHIAWFAFFVVTQAEVSVHFLGYCADREADSDTLF